jgi:predicted esterase
MTRISLVLSLALLSLASPALAADAVNEAFRVLDAAESAEDPSSQLPALEKLCKKKKPDKVAEALRKGRRRFEEAPSSEANRIEDGLGRGTDLYVVIPSKRPKAGYGVIILLHGLGGNGQQLLGQYRSFAQSQGMVLLSPSAQKLPGGGQPGPSGKPTEANEDSMGREPMQHWWHYRSSGFALRALSWIKRRLPIDTDRVVMSGYSMGGFGTWNTGLRFPDRFAGIAPMAGGISRRSAYGMSDPDTESLLGNALGLPLFFVHGAQDRTVPPTADRMCRDRLKGMKAPFQYYEDPQAAHNLSAWFGKNRPLYESWLKKRRRVAWPKQVDHNIIGAYMTRSYWLEVTSMSGSKASVTARFKSRNKIELKAKGANRFKLFLPPDKKLFDPKKKLEVSVNGKRVFSKKVKPSAAAILDSWRGREDHAQVSAYMVEVKAKR